MIVITLTDCPPKLRGDLSKWLCEINTGVYVGNLSGRVRDELWERVCSNLHTGRATMVFQTNNEQGLDFRVHNTTWEPVDFDGIKLMRRPKPRSAETPDGQETGFGYSKAAQFQKMRRIQAAQARSSTSGSGDYTVIDLETSGLDPTCDSIVEMGAIRVRDGVCTEQLSLLIQQAKLLPDGIKQLTGITDEMLENGLPLDKGLQTFLDFVGNDTLVGHHLAFDFSFLRAACRQCGMRPPRNRCEDTLLLARRQIQGIPNYKLNTLAEYFSLPYIERHRAVADCELTQIVYTKLRCK